MPNPQRRVEEQLAQQSWGLLGTQGSVLGVDIGGYGLRASLIDLHRHTYLSRATETESTEPTTILNEIFGLIRGLFATAGLHPERLVRIGVGFGGPVDLHHGRVRLSPRMQGWENFSLKEAFEQEFDTVTLVENDANLIALGEATFGIGQGANHLFYLHLSGGVGGGMVLDGRLYRGATSSAGEIGHAVVGHPYQKENRLLNLEELVSVSALLRRANEQGLATDQLEDLFRDHPVGQRIINETTDLLALRIAHLIVLLDPEMIVLGGAVVRAGGDLFVQAIAQQIHHYIHPQFSQPVHVVASVLGADSIAIGALALALASLQD